jgi:hypothetical protein
MVGTTAAGACVTPAGKQEARGVDGKEKNAGRRRVGAERDTLNLCPFQPLTIKDRSDLKRSLLSLVQGSLASLRQGLEGIASQGGW